MNLGAKLNPNSSGDGSACGAAWTRLRGRSLRIASTWPQMWGFRAVLLWWCNYILLGLFFLCVKSDAEAPQAWRRRQRLSIPLQCNYKVWRDIYEQNKKCCSCSHLKIPHVIIKIDSSAHLFIFDSYFVVSVLKRTFSRSLKLTLAALC